MSGFLFAFVAALIAGFGARDQVMIAHLSARLGPRASLLLVAWAGAASASALAAWGAAALAGQVPDAARLLLAAIALAAAGVELGKNYPRPLVRHDEARARTLERYAVVKKTLA